MSWASRRRFAYLSGVVVFFLVVLGGPLAYWYFSIPPTCSDGIQNQGETGVDVGGPCPVLDPRALQSEAILWARSFRVRDGRYNAVAYIQNPNDAAGVARAHYRFGLYDEQNILIAEREGDTVVMPGVVTPVLESRIDTGNRIVAHTYFALTSPLVWQRLDNAAKVLSINDKQLSGQESEPREDASVTNESVADVSGAGFVAVVFDPAGNAFAASGTTLPKIASGATERVVFTWPDPFAIQVGRVDILPVVTPAPPRAPR